MKKWVSGILLCAAAVSLAACGNKNASSGEGTEKPRRPERADS